MSVKNREVAERIADSLGMAPTASFLQRYMYEASVLKIEKILDEAFRPPQLPTHGWDDVLWIEQDDEYEASCWCGWTHSCWSYVLAREALDDHLKDALEKTLEDDLTARIIGDNR